MGNHGLKYHAVVREIPLMRPRLPSALELLPYLQRIDSRRWYTNFGPLHEELLQALISRQAGRERAAVHGCLVASATAGLELALAALDLPAGSRVGVPAFSFPATATAVHRCGHQPVAADVDADTWLLRPQTLAPRQAREAGLAAVMPVAVFGMPQDARGWSAWSAETGLPVIIDAAAAWDAQDTAEGVDAVFSLHATKPLSSGEGGLVLSRNGERIRRLQHMSNFGIGYGRPTVAGNAKLSEYHAAVGLAHLSLWPAQVRERRLVRDRYRQGLEACEAQGLRWQADTGLAAPSVLCVRLRDARQRDACENALAAAGVQTRRWYQPLLPRQPMLGTLDCLGPLPEATALSEQLLGLPFFIDLAPEDVDAVVGIMTSVCLPATGGP